MLRDLADGGRRAKGLQAVAGAPFVALDADRTDLARLSLSHGAAAAGLVPGMTVGDTSNISASLTEDLRTTGLTHLTAVSGTNLTLVVGFLLVVARWCGVRGRWLALVAVLGIVGFAVVVVTGVLAVARVSLPRWYWAGLAAGALLGTVFVHWLIFQSLYRIGALCPYCMVVWSVTIPLLVVATSIAAQPQRSANALVRGLYTWRWSLVALWFTAVVLMILERFWTYWSTLV